MDNTALLEGWIEVNNRFPWPEEQKELATVSGMTLVQVKQWLNHCCLEKRDVFTSQRKVQEYLHLTIDQIQWIRNSNILALTQYRNKEENEVRRVAYEDLARELGWTTSMAKNYTRAVQYRDEKPPVLYLRAKDNGTDASASVPETGPEPLPEAVQGALTHVLSCLETSPPRAVHPKPFQYDAGQLTTLLIVLVCPTQSVAEGFTGYLQTSHMLNDSLPLGPPELAQPFHYQLFPPSVPSPYPNHSMQPQHDFSGLSPGVPLGPAIPLINTGYNDNFVFSTGYGNETNAIITPQHFTYPSNQFTLSPGPIDLLQQHNSTITWNPLANMNYDAPAQMAGMNGTGSFLVAGNTNDNVIRRDYEIQGIEIPFNEGENIILNGNIGMMVDADDGITVNADAGMVTEEHSVPVLYGDPGMVVDANTGMNDVINAGGVIMMDPNLNVTYNYFARQPSPPPHIFEGMNADLLRLGGLGTVIEVTGCGYITGDLDLQLCSEAYLDQPSFDDLVFFIGKGLDKIAIRTTIEEAVKQAPRDAELKGHLVITIDDEEEGLIRKVNSEEEKIRIAGQEQDETPKDLPTGGDVLIFGKLDDTVALLNIASLSPSQSGMFDSNAEDVGSMAAENEWEEPLDEICLTQVPDTPIE